MTVQLPYRLHISNSPNFSHFKPLMISKFGVPQSVASIHSLQFLNSCRSYVSVTVIFRGVSSSVIMYGNRRFGFASAEESFAIMKMSMVRQPVSQRYAGHEEAHSLLVPIPAPLTRLRSSLKCTKDYIAFREEEGTKWPTCCESETAACIVNVVVTNFIWTFVNNVVTKCERLFCERVWNIQNKLKFFQLMNK